MSVRIGEMVRVKSFSVHYPGREHGIISARMGPLRKRDGRGQYFCMLLLGSDDGPSEEGAVDPNTFIEGAGWVRCEKADDARGELRAALRLIETGGSDSVRERVARALELLGGDAGGAS